MQRWWWPRRLLPAVVTIVLVLASLPMAAPRQAGAGSPVFPDLRAGLPPNIKLRFEPPGTGAERHWLLRFDGITENHGGALEIVADLARSRDIYQQVYDQRAGGDMVLRRKITTDLLFHPTHDHFHVSNLARFQLLKKSPTGVYRETDDPAAKTSFCILDSIRVQGDAPASTFFTCNSSRQGLTAGWADIYGWYLPEQFIDLGTTRPADGDYAIQITVDPLDVMLESDDANNTTTAFFSIVDGQTAEPSDEPFCSASPSSAGVGQRVHVACEHLSPGKTYDMHWSTAASSPVATSRGDGDGRVAGSFLLPMSPSGVHTIFVIAQGTEKQHTAAVTVRTSIDASPANGPVGSRLTIGLTGLSGGESVTTSMDLGNGSVLKIAQRTAREDGSSLYAVAIPSATYGAHTVTVTTSRTKKSFKLPFNVEPSLTIPPGSSRQGELFYPQLRGFGGGEVVSIVVQSSPQRVLRRLTVYSTGALGSSAGADVRVPLTLPPGDYVVYARGQTTHATGYDTLTVLAASGTPTSTPTRTPSATPTATSTATSTATATPTSTATATPTGDPGGGELAESTSSPTPTETAAPDLTATETTSPEPPSETATSTPEPTATETATATPDPPTETATLTPEPNATETPLP